MKSTASSAFFAGLVLFVAAHALHAQSAAPASSPTFGFGLSGAGTGPTVKVGSDHTLRLPSGWTSTETPDGVLLLPAGVSFAPDRDDNPEVYLVASRDDYDSNGESQVARQLGASITQRGGSGGHRQPLTFGTRRGAAYRWDIAHQRTGQPLAFDVYVAAEGSHAFVLIAIGDPTRIRAQDSALRQILASAAAAAPVVASGGSLGDSTPLAQRWINKLRGQTVRQFWASQGMSSDKKHWFNADGSYAFRSDSMVSVSVPGAGALATDGDNTRGRWRIVDQGGQVSVEIRTRNGQVRRLRITEDERHWYLNGEKAYVTD